MNSLTKLALGLMGQLKPRHTDGEPAEAWTLPPPQVLGGVPLMEALSRRESTRAFDPEPLAPQVLSDLLWAAAGINRASLGGRTAPSALNAQEVLVYAALPGGLYRYDPAPHALHLVTADDVRRVTGYQDFVDTAPLDLIYVADHERMKLVPAGQREAFAFAAAGAMAQNVYLFCASAGLGAVIRAWFDHRALAEAMGLDAERQLLLAQTVGRPGGAR
ncbi:MAG: SagB/ThcOx family dehydrogenase [Burkholderiaceae bacterium]|nr:SagB/ThcOx family dehydrogenase [Burkholderiaceae bacterium]